MTLGEGPQQESADGLSPRELQEVTGASLPNFGKGILPSVEENKCRPVIGHPVDWCNTAVGRQRKTVSSMPAAASLQGALFGGLIHPSFVLSGSLKPCSQDSRFHVLHICIYMTAPYFGSF